MILMVDFKKVKPPNIGDMFDKSVEQWSISEKLHLASEYRKLQCDNIECHCWRDILKSVWEAIHQTPACGLNAILCGSAQEIDALRSREKAFMKIIYKHVDPLDCNEDDATTVDMINLIINTYG